MSKQKIIIISTIGLIVLLAGIAYIIWDNTTRQEVSTETPGDIVLDFYLPWLNAVKSTTTDPYIENLSQDPLLSPELRSRLVTSQSNPEAIDPVLCQTMPPEKLAARTVFQTEEKAEILVTARPATFSSEQAIVTLLAHKGGWYIDTIKCAPGEFGPDRDFTFEQEGNLIKSVPEPLNSENWHFIFEENGEPGHFTPLFFTTESTCKTVSGTTNVCNPDTFTEPSQAFIQGEMTEEGVTVKSLELKS